MEGNKDLTFFGVGCIQNSLACLIFFVGSALPRLPVMKLYNYGLGGYNDDHQEFHVSRGMHEGLWQGN